jgi:hypothetical protein
MPKEKFYRFFATLYPRFASVIIQQRLTALLVVLLLLVASAVGTYSIQAFSSPTGSNPQPWTKPAFQVAALSSVPTARFIENGRPWINLEDGKDVESSYTGDANAVETLTKGLAKPLALTSADYDEDGVIDAVAGYAGPKGGIIVLWRGNADAIYPNSPEAQLHKKQGTFTNSPYLSPALVFEAPANPEFLAAGDFDADGHQDLLMTSRDSSQLALIKGTGKAGFESTAWIALPGNVTALAVGDVNRGDGLPDIVVATATSGIARMLVFESLDGALKGQPEVFALSAEAKALAIGQLDETDSFADIAAAVGRTVLITHGRDRKLGFDLNAQTKVGAAVTESRALDVAIKGLAIGDYTKSVENDLAVLGADGAVQLLNRNSKQGGLSTWQNRRLNTPVLSNAAQLLSAKVSSLPYESLIVVDAASNQIQFLTDGTDSGRKEAQSLAVPAVASALLEVDNRAVALMTAHLNADASSDLVLLRGNQTALSVVPSTVSATFQVLNTNDSGAGSLRQAITDANNNPGADMITFAIGSGTQTITPLADLPAILDPVTVDATTQPGYAGAPIIELNGINTGSGRIFKVSGGTTTIRGVVMNRCLLNAVTFQNNGNNKIENCYVGTDVAGTAALPNFDGVSVSNIANNTVGGTTAAARNVISGNTRNGVDITGSVTGNNLVQGNYIGTNAAGSAALGNQNNGVYLNAKTNTVGGTTAAARNVISGNTLSGVRILNDVTITGNKVQGNHIGMNVGTTMALPNGEGVSILNAPDHTIGGTVAGAGNLIAGNTGNGVLISQDKATGNMILGNTIGTAGFGNGGHGVRIDVASNNSIGAVAAFAANTISFNGLKGIIITGGGASIANAIRQNAIFFNQDLGIDLGGNGVTPNDAGDVDAGENDLQNFPVITMATGGASTNVQGTYNSLPNQTLVLEFFLNAVCDTSGFGEGEQLIGSIQITTNASGNATFNTTFATASSLGQGVTATAVATNFSTSEFSQCVPVCAYVIAPTSQTINGAGGTGSVNVTTGAGCPWTAVSNVSWITITSGASGTGSGTVNYSVAANISATPRTGTLTIAGQTFTVTQSTVGTQTIGLYRPSISTFYLRNSNTPGFPDLSIPYGAVGDLPVVGDWDGNGTTTIGVYRPSTSTFYLRNSNTLGLPDITASLGDGPGGDLPVVGDWNGDGVWTIGVYRPSTSTFYLKNTNTTGAPDLTIPYGASGDKPVVGDWDGNGTTTIGVYRSGISTFFLKNSNTVGFPDITVVFGNGPAGDLPIVGDFDGNGTVTIGVYQPSTSTFLLRNNNTPGAPDITVSFGASGDLPLIGNWDGQ